MKSPADNTGGLSPVKRALLALEEMEARLKVCEYERREPIAITGIGCRFPSGANDPESFWRLLRNGVDAIGEVPRERWDAAAMYHPDASVRGKTNARWGGFLSGVDQFDPAFFGISPREAAHMDPQQRLVLEVAWEALEDAGEAVERLAGSRTGVFLGIYNNDYAWLQSNEPDEVDVYSATGSGQAIAANRLSYLLDLQGPSLAVDTTCSSSLVAVHLACQSLRNGESQVALAGGVNLILSPLIALSVSKVVPMAADGRCKTFDARADGIVRGEGCGFVVLKRLSNALADHDNIIALIQGSAVNQDGHSNGFTAPSSAAQQAVIRQALQNAGVGASQISYVEAHGTGTPLGDPIELEALDAVLGNQRAHEDPCLVGSVKTNLGHLEAAAGIAGLIKVALSLQHRAIPPHLHFTKLNPHISLANGSFEIPTELRRWKDEAKKLYAGVSSFSLGGTNAHVVLTEPPAQPAPAAERSDMPSEQAYLLPISARSEEALRASAAAYREQLRASSSAGEPRLSDVAYAASVRRSHLPYRLALVGRTGLELASQLDSFLDTESHPALATGRVTGKRQGLAFVFSGQGTQWHGMGIRLMEQEPCFRKALAECSELFYQFGGFDLLDELKRERDDSRLDETHLAQPAIFAMQVALTALLREWGVEPDAVIGHSLGEIAAAYTAGILSLPDAARIVCERARLFKKIAGQGRMAAVELDVQEARRLLQGFADQLSIAAINSPTTVVLSGEPAALQEVLESLGQKQVRYRYLRGNCAFHSQQIEPLLPELVEALRDLTPRSSSIPFISTVTGESVSGSSLDAAYWARNARETVQFTKAIERLAGDHDTFVEISPHAALSGNLAQCLGSRQRAAKIIPALRRDTDERTMLLRLLGALYTAGHPARWERLYPARGRHVRLPSYQWQRSRHWIQNGDHTKTRAQTTLANAPVGAASLSHPLLGRRLQTPLRVFESQLSASALQYLNHHRIGGEIVFPAAGYLEIALAAAGECFPAGMFAVHDLIFHERLIIPTELAKTVQSILTPENSDVTAIQIFSLEQEEEELPSSWKLHAAGRICKAGRAFTFAGKTALEELRASFVEEFPVATLYEMLRQRGFHSGEIFQSVERVWRKNGEALGQVRLSPELVGEAAAYRFHPALLDACFQTIIAALPSAAGENGEDEIFLSTGMERFACLDVPGSEVWSHAVFRPHDELNQETRTVDVYIYDSSGVVVAEVAGLSLKRLPRRALKIADRHSGECFYETQWQPKPRASSPGQSLSTRMPVSTIEIAQQLRAQTERTVEQFGLGKYLAIEPEVDTLCAAYVVDALRDLGLSLRVGQRIPAKILSEGPGILPRHHRLWKRFLEILLEDEILISDGGEFEVRQLPERGAAELKLQTLMDAHPAHKTELSLLRRCGSQLAKVLRGECDALELLFPGGELAEAEHLYQATPFAQTFNTLVEQALRLALENLRDGETIRVLEIGAGTGGTSSSVLPLLPAGRTQYAFTDVSNLFLFKAKQKFSSYPFIEYKLLDIERDPQEQGFARQQFDVVIAANVLHGTSDLRRTLKHVRELMAADGLLVLLESTGAQRLVDLTFGLTEDWWNFADTDLRPSHPLLAAGKWLDLLTESGFASASSVPAPDDASQVNLQTALIFAQAQPVAPEQLEVAGRRAEDCRGHWLIFDDGGAVSHQLAENLRSRGGTVMRVYPSTSFEKMSEGRWSINPSVTEDFRSLMRKVPETLPCRGVVYLWSLKADVTEDAIRADALSNAALDDCASVLGLVQAVSQTAFQVSPRLWIVTRCAQPVAAQNATFALSSSTLWGLGSVIAMEHSEMWGGLIDLDATAPKDEHEALLEEMLSGSNEDRVAYRDGQRYVARLRPRSREHTSALVRLEEDATYLITGGFGGMGLRVALWMVERGARNLVLAGRKGATTDEARHVLQQLERAGAKVIAAQADVSREEEVSKLLDDLKDTMPPLRGIIHAAGIFDDRVLMRHDRERFARVLAPKVNGAWNLHRLTSEMLLDFFILFSSAAAFLGLMGLGNYTAANAFLDALAHYRRGRGLRALTIDWGGWTRVGMADVLGEFRESQWMSKGLDSLLPHQGLQALNDLMLQDAEQVAVLNVDWPTFFQQLSLSHVPPLLSELASTMRRQVESSPVQSPAGDFLRKFNEASHATQSSLLREHICRQVAKILELDAALALDHSRPLAEFGLDSLMAVELRNMLATSIGHQLPATLLFDCPTIDAVYAYLASYVFSLEQPPSAINTPHSSGHDAELDGLLDELEDLSDDAVEKMLEGYASGLLRQ